LRRLTASQSIRYLHLTARFFQIDGGQTNETNARRFICARRPGILRALRLSDFAAMLALCFRVMPW